MLELTPQSRIVFVGDSVTDAGRDYTALPGGWGFGTGYVNHIHNLLCAVYPDASLMTINSGVSGDDIDLMAARWKKDVLDFQPEYVSIMIGINDVWRHFDGQFRQAATHTADYFEEKYGQLIEDLQMKDEHLKQVYIVSPVMFETSRDDAMRALLDDFQAAAQRVAERYDLPYINVQAAVDEALRYQHTCQYSPDRVHPNERGAMVMARAWLQAVGFDWERTDLDGRGRKEHD